MAFEYKHIVVAVDGSEEAERALNKAIDIAKRNHAELVISHVIDTRAYAPLQAYDRTIAEQSEKFARDLLNEYREKAEDAGLRDVKIDLEYGSPRVKIPKDVAPRFKADLIVCGATGLNAVERFLIGSVSEHITRYAEVDVLVVRS
ncbi:nucleotide-binding universal stress UspA family protein [Melghiribacillus thermohalophilus]|uniref:Universal stress protein n=1 Tax=Melghiribacillus thermohalophilus TaxID=1324956 RepID=A0A4V2V2F8_9BACI|nr:universal stress protein [Melghiribacillus thermohalophilus]TCT24962.1 nucleotide-binding universal stress UspA family protein [Melghiribacillus thermohalophilus]